MARLAAAPLDWPSLAPGLWVAPSVGGSVMGSIKGSVEGSVQDWSPQLVAKSLVGAL